MRALPLQYESYGVVDQKQIEQLFEHTFGASEGAAVGTVIRKLVSDLMSLTDLRDLFGYVATLEAQIVGGVFFSRLTYADSDSVFILSPMAVHPAYQGQLVGQRLINYGIKQVTRMGVEVLFTYGDPQFYSKVGFCPVDEKQVSAPLTLSQPEGWLAQSLHGKDFGKLQGKPRCVEALANPDYW